METAATSGETEKKRSYPRNDNNNGRRNFRGGGGGGGGGGGQAALKLENPMRVQRVVQAPPPRRPREDNGSRGQGGQDRNSRPERNSRPVASTGPGNSGGSDNGPGSKSESSDYIVSKPKKTFGDGRCQNLSYVGPSSGGFQETAFLTLILFRQQFFWTCCEQIRKKAKTREKRSKE